MTRKLYYQDPYQFEFSAHVLSCQARDGHFVVILDQTCFYPEGGGQPADHGWLNEVPVFDVQLHDGEIWHVTRDPLPEGLVRGRLDRRRRIDFMQQHTGQHIFTRSLQEVGHHSTLSVHFGEAYTAIEIDAPEVSEKILQQAEDLANQIVQQNRAVTSYWLKPEQAVQMGLWKNLETLTNVRVVEIAGFDRSACGGTHVKSTGEVGWVKIVQLEKIRGHWRIQLKIGQRTREDYARKIRLVRELSKTLTCGETELVPRVQTLVEDLRRTQKTVKKLQSELMAYRAQEALSEAEPLGEGRLVIRIFRDVPPEALRAFVQEVLRHPGYLVLTITVNGESLNWIFAHSWPQELDLKSLVEPFLPLLAARGGGKGNLLQGGGGNPAGIESFLGKLTKRLQQEIGA